MADIMTLISLVWMGCHGRVWSLLFEELATFLDAVGFLASFDQVALEAYLTGPLFSGD